MNNPINLQNEAFSQSESTQAFAKLPKVLITEPQYKHLKANHMAAYSLMLDRLQLSITNQMKDNNGTPFIYYAVENVAKDVHCSVKTAGKVVAELDRTGLIRKVKQGQGKPNRIYVYDVFQADQSKQLVGTRSEYRQEPSKEQAQTGILDALRQVSLPSLNQSKILSNKTEISKTDRSKTENSNTDNSNYAVNGNERALNGGVMTSDAKNYLLTRNEQSMVREVSNLLFELVATPSRYICIDGKTQRGYDVSVLMSNISGAQIQTALDSVGAEQYSAEERRDYLISALYRAVDQTGNADTLAEISKETQERNRRRFDRQLTDFLGE